MTMSFYRLPAIIACAILAVPTVATPGVIDTPYGLVSTTPSRKKKKVADASVAPRYRRSKGAQAKPKRHANRMHISKRVRRKHRRAA